MTHEFAARALVLTATYLMHSTLLLGAVWALTVCFRVRSHVLNERLWKAAAVLGAITAPLQIAANWSQPLATAELTLEPTSAPKDAPTKDAPPKDAATKDAPPSATGSSNWPGSAPTPRPYRYGPCSASCAAGWSASARTSAGLWTIASAS